MLRIICALALSAALVGCITGELMRDIREGMSKDEVIGILGNPDGFQRSS